MKSELHQKLQDKATAYLLAKTYWITSQEMPCPFGVIDVWGLSRSKNMETASIEVKVSRSDWQTNQYRWKESMGGRIANYCYLLCPAGMIKKDEGNPYVGLLWHEEGKKLKLVRKPTKLEQTDREKLEILINYLDNGANMHKPKI